MWDWGFTFHVYNKIIVILYHNVNDIELQKNYSNVVPHTTTTILEQLGVEPSRYCKVTYL